MILRLRKYYSAYFPTIKDVNTTFTNSDFYETFLLFFYVKAKLHVFGHK